MRTAGARGNNKEGHRAAREVERLRFEGPALHHPLFRFSGGHGGDEYGNCTLYFRCPLFGIVWWYPTGHYQTEVELPETGKCEWVDKVIYRYEGDRE